MPHAPPALPVLSPECKQVIASMCGSVWVMHDHTCKKSHHCGIQADPKLILHLLQSLLHALQQCQRLHLGQAAQQPRKHRWSRKHQTAEQPICVAADLPFVSVDADAAVSGLTAASTCKDHGAFWDLSQRHMQAAVHTSAALQ